MQYRFNKHLEQLLPSGDKPLKILVAVSGGADSMCLLNLLYNTSLDITVSIAHVNFHLRGEESCKDETLVREWARDNSVEIFVKDVDTISYAQEKALSIEMAARELRYNWFEELRAEHGFDYIAVAHHANDNAETLLLNLVRGAGIHGICGMKELDSNRAILRPLLDYTREEIEKYVAKHSVPYRTDHTNLESEYYRNRIRNIVMPQLEGINPSLVTTLNRNMRYFTQVSAIVDSVATEKWALLVKKDCNETSGFLDVIKNSIVKLYSIRSSAPYLECYISINELLKEQHYSYWLYGILSEYSFNSSQIEGFTATLQQRESKKIISETHIAVQERGFVKVYKKEIQPESVTEPVAIDDFENGKEILFNGRKLNLVKLSGSDALVQFAKIKNQYPLSLMFDADNLHFPLTLTTVCNGLKWKPFGMNGAKKVSDYLMDLKMDSILKSNVAVLSDGANEGNPGNIICLPGLQISNLYKVTEKTDSVIVISLI